MWLWQHGVLTPRSRLAYDDTGCSTGCFQRDFPVSVACGSIFCWPEARSAGEPLHSAEKNWAAADFQNFLARPNTRRPRKKGQRKKGPFFLGLRVFGRARKFWKSAAAQIFSALCKAPRWPCLKSKRELGPKEMFSDRECIGHRPRGTRSS